MSQHQKQQSKSRAFVQVLATSSLIMLGLLLVACGTIKSTDEGSVPQVATAIATVTTIASSTAGSSATAQLTPQVTETSPPVATMERTLIPGTQAPTWVPRTRTFVPKPTYVPGDSKSAFDTRVAQNQATRWAILDLTPSNTPGSPTATSTPAPTATEIIGWTPFCGGAANSYENQYASCWQLIMNGHLYSIWAGRFGYLSDEGQGLITVYEMGTDNRFDLIGTYLTPSRQGSVEIAAVDGTRVYLVQSQSVQPPDIDVTPIPNFVFVFDLATLQWVSP